MSSYKHVIYGFSAIGALAIIGIGALILTQDKPFYSVESNLSIDDMQFSDPSTAMDGLTDFSFDEPTDPFETDLSRDEYLGITVPYKTMRDARVMGELKIPDTDGMDLMMLAVLRRPDTSLEEIYQSDTHLALLVKALNNQLQTIIIQDLSSGAIYDTEIRTRRNFLVVGSQIVYVTAVQPDSAIQIENEMTQAHIYDIPTNTTQHLDVLPETESFTKGMEVLDPLADLKLVNGKAQISVYSRKEPVSRRADTTPIRTISLP